MWQLNWMNRLAGNISKLKIKNSEEVCFGEEALLRNLLVLI